MSDAWNSGDWDMIRVAIVDDHPIALRGITGLLCETEQFHVTAAVATAADLTHGHLVGEAAPDVVIMDLYHDGHDPCLAAIVQLSAVTRVLVVSASAKPSDVVGAVRAGASGYVTKHADAQLLRAALETVAAGGFALSAHLADILQASLRQSSSGRAPDSDVVTLSAREEQTLDLIAEGFTHAQVATRLGVSKATVDTYVERIRSKLQVGNKAELTRAAMERLKARDRQ